MNRKIHFAFLIWFLLCGGFPSKGLCAQQRSERTIDEIKIEAVHRAAVGQYPLIGLDPGDVKEAFASL